MDVEDIVDPNGPPAWLYLLKPMQRAWREKQILMGRDPDPYILSRLKEAGSWPPKKKAKDAPRTKRRKAPRRRQPARRHGRAARNR
jgi:hypothetical protein